MERERELSRINQVSPLKQLPMYQSVKAVVNVDGSGIGAWRLMGLSQEIVARWNGVLIPLLTLSLSGHALPSRLFLLLSL